MKRFLLGFLYAWKGIKVAVTEQRNLKIQIAIGVVVMVLAFYFQVTATEWCILLLAIALVLGLELLNTAVEDMVNLITPERHRLAGRIKDIAAGAVLIVSIISAVIGFLIFGKYLV